MPDQSTTHFEAPLSCRFLIWNMCFNGLRNRSRPEKRRCCHHAGPIPAHNIEGDPHHRIDERNLDQREESKPLKPRSSPSPDPLASAVIQREDAPASQHASGQLQIIRASCAIGQSALSLAPRCGVGSAPNRMITVARNTPSSMAHSKDPPCRCAMPEIIESPQP